MSNCKKCVGKSAVVVATTVALVVAGAVGGYVYAVNKTKQKFDESVKNSVDLANMYAKQQELFSFKVNRSDADSSFAHDKYVVTMQKFANSSDFFKINMDCNYGFASVTSDLKFDFGDFKETSEVFKKIEDSIKGRFDFSALTNASSLVIDLNSGEHKTDSVLVKWDTGNFELSVPDYTKPTDGSAGLKFNGMKITDFENEGELSFSNINAEFAFANSKLHLDNFLLKEHNNEFITIKNVDFSGKSKLNFDEKKVSFEMNYGTEKAYIDQLVSTVGSFNIEGLKFGFQLNNLNVAPFLDYCKLQNTKEDWMKISECAQNMDNIETSSVGLESIKDIDGNILFATKLNASAVDFKLDYKFNSKSTNMLEMMTSVVLNADLKFDKSLFDNVPLLSSYKDIALAYVTDNGSQYGVQLNCAEGKCNLNGKKLF